MEASRIRVRAERRLGEILKRMAETNPQSMALRETVDSELSVEHDCKLRFADGAPAGSVTHLHAHRVGSFPQERKRHHLAYNVRSSGSHKVDFKVTLAIWLPVWSEEQYAAKDALFDVRFASGPLLIDVKAEGDSDRL